MSKSVMISLLKQGETGDQILQILNTITESSESMNEPTLEPIEF